MSRTKTSLITTLLSLLALLVFPAPRAEAQSWVEDDDGIRQAVARVAYISGYASYNRGDDPDDWQPALVNFPMTQGDRLYTHPDSRLELQTRSSRVFVAPDTDFAALTLTDTFTQYSVTLGTASFRLRDLRYDEMFEVATPNVSVMFRTAGYYRIDVDNYGNTTVTVWSGSALVSAGGGEVLLEAGDQMSVDGFERPRYDVYAAGRADAWDRWVDTRSRRYRNVRAATYVNPSIEGLEDLDEYGRWEHIPSYGWAWTPAVAGRDWRPYYAGRWIWQDPWGWTWLSSEPWGWAPYHYGRWVVSRDRWYWVPVAPSVRTYRYAPALVAFVGGGPGFSVSISVGGGGYVGWFPLSPRDPFVRWWGPRINVNITNITFVHRSRVIVVDRTVFAGGRVVDRDVVRDRGIVRQVSTGPVFGGPLPILPTNESIRIRESGRTVSRPPAASAGRVVVTRKPPAPAPLPFSEKEKIIRNNAGAPVEWERLQPEARTGRPSTGVVPSRDAGSPSGGIVLSPRENSIPSRQVAPITVPSRNESPSISRPSNETLGPPPAERAPVHTDSRPVTIERPTASPRERERVPESRPADTPQVLPERERKIKEPPRVNVPPPPDERFRTEPIRRDPPIEQQGLKPEPKPEQRPVENRELKPPPKKEKAPEAKPETLEAPPKKQPKPEATKDPGR